MGTHTVRRAQRAAVALALLSLVLPAALLAGGSQNVSAGIKPTQGDTYPCGPDAPQPIPSPGSTDDACAVTSTGVIGDLNVYLDISHTWVAHLTVTLTHEDTGTRAVLIDRPGIPAGSSGCSRDDILAQLDDEAATPVEDECGSKPFPTIDGAFIPNEPLSAFDGESLSGTWTLTVSDAGASQSGSLNAWYLFDTDEDLDGCTASEEAGADPTLGGGRDANWFWDFFDTPDGANERDRAIDTGDVFRVVARFGTSGDPGIDPLSPAPASGYHTAFDRSAPAPGGEPWDLNPPDGTIDISDIFFAVNQFGHTCSGTP